MPAEEFLHPEYGERIYPDSIFRTRINTWSNIFYACFGFHEIGLKSITGSEAGHWSEGNLCVAPVQTFLFGLAGIYLGLGSRFFHAYLTRFGQQCDVGGMYSTLLCLAGLALGSWLSMLRIPKTCQILPSWPLVSVGVLGCLYP